MELDDLKEAWTALDNRLKRNEELEESIILEIMQSKAGRSLNRLINWEIISALLCLVFIPCAVLALDHWSGILLIFDIFFIYAIIVVIIGFFWYIFKTRSLMKIDLSKSVGENILYINQYNILLKREKISTDFVVGPVFIILMVLGYMEANAKFQQWVVLVCAVALASLSGFWTYKRFYRKNIDSIIKSLNEIRELKEE